MGEAKRRSAAGTAMRRLTAPADPAPLAKFVLPAGPSAAGQGPAPESVALAERVRGEVRVALVRGAAERSLDRMLEAIDALGEAMAAGFESALAAAGRAPERSRELGQVACRRGCAFCCHVEVAVTPLEAIRLARRRAPGAAPAPTAAPRAPCPLLEAGACSQYAHRPYACRALFSRDAGRCAEGFASDAAVFVPSLDWPRDLAAGYISGELAALADLGLESHMVALRPALALLGAAPGAVLRWLNGAAVFPRPGR